MTKILFVCTGNICRSPTAEAIARKKAHDLNKKIIFDSAGTSGYHQGEKPDSRSVEVCQTKNISFSDIYSRKICDQDFIEFDYIFAMDRSHLSHLYNLADKKYHHKIHLFLQFCATSNIWNDEVIDPYYGERGFEEVYEIIDESIDNLFKII